MLTIVHIEHDGAHGDGAAGVPLISAPLLVCRLVAATVASSIDPTECPIG